MAIHDTQSKKSVAEREIEGASVLKEVLIELRLIKTQLELLTGDIVTSDELREIE